MAFLTYHISDARNKTEIIIIDRPLRNRVAHWDPEDEIEVRVWEMVYYIQKNDFFDVLSQAPFRGNQKTAAITINEPSTKNLSIGTFSKEIELLLL